jgi:hypothetical protein
MPQSQGLTNLHDSKENLRRDIQKANSDHEQEVLQQVSEISNLVRRKFTLIKQIKDLFTLYTKIKGAKSRLEEGFDAFANDRMDTLEWIGSEISQDLQEKEESLDIRSKGLDSLEAFVDEFFAYLIEYHAICEAETSLNALRGVANSREQLSLNRGVDQVLKSEKRATVALENANRLEGLADSRYQDADKVAKEFEKKWNKEKERLKSEDLRLKSKDIDLKARERTMDREKQRLSERERLLSDKEGAFRRLVHEVKGSEK